MNLANGFKFQGGINGLKLVLGAAMVVTAGQIGVLNELIPVFPDASKGLSTAVEILKGALGVGEVITNILGNGLLSLGVVHKVVKVFQK